MAFCGRDCSGLFNQKHDSAYGDILVGLWAMVGLGLDIEVEANALVNHFIGIGIPREVAKKCAIKTLREKIQELELIDGVHMIGLKPRIDIIRETILFIVEM